MSAPLRHGVEPLLRDADERLLSARGAAPASGDDVRVLMGALDREVGVFTSWNPFCRGVPAGLLVKQAGCQEQDYEKSVTFFEDDSPTARSGRPPCE